MTIFPNIDLNTIAPIAAALALAVFVGIVLLLRSVLRSRVVVPLAIVIGVVLAGPALSGTLAIVVNALVIGAVLLSIASIAMLLVIRSHPELQALARDALSLIPRRSTIAPTPIAENRQNAITVIDQPAQVLRVTRHNDAGKDWGF